MEFDHAETSEAGRVIPDSLGERLRLQALKEYELLDTPPEPYYDSLTRIASRLTDAPICLVSLVDSHRQFFKSAFGLSGNVEDLRETPLTHSFCQHVVKDHATMIVTDSLEDERVKENLAVRDLGVAAYLGAPIIDSNGNALGAFCAIDSTPREWSASDIQAVEDFALLVVTELDRGSSVKAAAALAEKLQQQNSHMKDCMAILAHDLKNPLSGIIFSAAMMREHLPPDKPQLSEMLEAISTSSDRMDAHINQLLEKGANGISCLVFDSKLIDLKKSASGAIANQCAQLDKKSMTVKVDSPEKDCIVQADLFAVNQILDNLLSNAIKFSPEGSEITIEIEPTRFTLTDQGSGFTAEDKPRIFDRFVRLSAAATHEARSTGLGLYICKQLSEAMGGTIECLSAPGQPASFRVSFES